MNNLRSNILDHLAQLDNGIHLKNYIDRTSINIPIVNINSFFFYDLFIFITMGYQYNPISIIEGMLSQMKTMRHKVRVFSNHKKYRIQQHSSSVSGERTGRFSSDVVPHP